MKFTSLLFLLVFSSFLSAQIKIDPHYTIITKGKEFRNGSYYMPDLSKTDSIFIKELATNSLCQMTWCRWKFVLEGQEVIIKDMEQVPNYLLLLKPKDKIIMDKIVLLPDCFAPPEKIVIGII